jgi:3-oxoadipate enol-lactonase/4-carboxymuconolactone decarboxylase
MFSSGSAIQQRSTWIERAAQVRASGTASLVVGSAGRWFAPGYLSGHPDGPGAGTLNELTEVDDLSYALCAEALGRFDRTASVQAITTPTLIVSAEHDAVTSPESMSRLADALPTARYVELADASHLSVLERPEEAAQLLADFLGQAETAGERGMRTRRAVLGDVHVDAATAAIIPETAAFQDFITRYAWGEIWTRPELSRRERSIATLAVLVADGHEHELRMHIRAAMRNGLSSTDIAEVIMHTALYAGLPPANRGLAILREVLAAIDDEPGDGEPTRG